MAAAHLGFLHEAYQKRLLKAVGFYIKFIGNELGPGLDIV